MSEYIDSEQRIEDNVENEIDIPDRLRFRSPVQIEPSMNAYRREQGGLDEGIGRPTSSGGTRAALSFDGYGITGGSVEDASSKRMRP